jgi:hypothetical protein
MAFSAAASPHNDPTVLPTSHALASRSVSTGSPPSPTHLFTNPTMYSINLVYEDGHVISQIVWHAMTIAQLQQIVAAPFRVSPERVFFACHGLPLNPGRTLGNPPAILANAYVYNFFSEHAMHQFLSPGVNRFPPSPGPRPPSFVPPPMQGPQSPGPALPPVLVRQQRTPSYTPSSSGIAHDKLRSGFRCPKFLGEARNWKV